VVRSSGRTSLAQDGDGLDLHQHVRIDERLHFDHRGCRADVAEGLPVGTGDGFPVTAMFVTYIRVRTTSSRLAPSPASAVAMISKTRRVCAPASPWWITFPLASSDVVPVT
jgi:hypothetical protein